MKEIKTFCKKCQCLGIDCTGISVSTGFTGCIYFNKTEKAQPAS